MDVAEALARHPALATLPGPSFDALVSATTTRSFRDGHVFLSEGGPGSEVWILLDGEVRISRMQGRVDVARLEPGALFGLVAIIDQQPRSATCVGVGPTGAASIPVSAMQLLFSSHAPIALALQETLAAQLAADVRHADSRLMAERAAHPRTG